MTTPKPIALPSKERLKLLNAQVNFMEQDLPNTLPGNIKILRSPSQASRQFYIRRPNEDNYHYLSSTPTEEVLGILQGNYYQQAIRYISKEKQYLEKFLDRYPVTHEEYYAGMNQKDSLLSLLYRIYGRIISITGQNNPMKNPPKNSSIRMKQTTGRKFGLNQNLLLPMSCAARIFPIVTSSASKLVIHFLRARISPSFIPAPYSYITGNILE